jgi:hypothetical protein
VRRDLLPRSICSATAVIGERHHTSQQWGDNQGELRAPAHAATMPNANAAHMRIDLHIGAGTGRPSNENTRAVAPEWVRTPAAVCVPAYDVGRGAGLLW